MDVRTRARTAAAVVIVAAGIGGLAAVTAAAVTAEPSAPTPTHTTQPTGPSGTIRADGRVTRRCIAATGSSGCPAPILTTRSTTASQSCSPNQPRGATSSARTRGVGRCENAVAAHGPSPLR